MSSGGMSSALGKLDPLGNKITQWGGDPLNLYGNQNNPNAAFFPSGTPASAVPIALPAPNGNVSPIAYNPNSFVQRQPAGPGAYNAMVAQLAGPVYSPQMQVQGQSQNLPPVIQNAGVSSTMGAAPAGAMPAGTTLAQLLAQARAEAAPTLPYNPKSGAMVYAK